MNSRSEDYARTLFACGALGCFWGCLTLLTEAFVPVLTGGDHWSLIALLYLPYGAAIGAAVGLACGVVAVPLLWKKQLAQVVVWLLVIVSPIVVGMAAIPGDRFYIGTYVLAFVAACVVLNRALKNPYPEGFCSDCGYDLTGNVSGVCPECGEDIIQPQRGGGD